MTEKWDPIRPKLSTSLPHRLQSFQSNLSHYPPLRTLALLVNIIITTSNINPNLDINAIHADSEILALYTEVQNLSEGDCSAQDDFRNQVHDILS